VADRKRNDFCPFVMSSYSLGQIIQKNSNSGFEANSNLNRRGASIIIDNALTIKKCCSEDNNAKYKNLTYNLSVRVPLLTLFYYKCYPPIININPKILSIKYPNPDLGVFGLAPHLDWPWVIGGQGTSPAADWLEDPLALYRNFKRKEKFCPDSKF
jgi:hypothetical protein